MDSISTSYGKQSSTPKITPKINSNKTEIQETLTFIAEGLENGITSISKCSDTDASIFAELSKEILNQLFDRKNENCIEIGTEHASFILTEIDDRVLISHDTTGYRLEITSLQNLQQSLIRDIFCHFTAYPEESINLVLEHIMFKALNDDCQYTQAAVTYIVNCPDDKTSADLKLAAAKHFFQHVEEYPDEVVEIVIKMIIRKTEECQIPMLRDAETTLLNVHDYSDISIKGALLFFINCPDNETTTVLKLAAASHVFGDECDYPDEIINSVAKIIIRNTEDCQIPVIEAVKLLMTHEDEYDFDSVQSASVYIIYNTADFTDAYFQLAVNHMLENSKEYSEKIFTRAALLFVLDNQQFFTAPIKNQQAFVSSFEFIKKIKVLEEYSDALLDVICEEEIVGTNVETNNGENDSEQSSIAKNFPILELWNSCKFSEALEARVELSFFLLSNMKHPAISTWYAQHEISSIR